MTEFFGELRESVRERKAWPSFVFLFFSRLQRSVTVCVCVCACVREKDARERERERESCEEERRSFRVGHSFVFVVVCCKKDCVDVLVLFLIKITRDDHAFERKRHKRDEERQERSMKEFYFSIFSCFRVSRKKRRSFLRTVFVFGCVSTSH